MAPTTLYCLVSAGGSQILDGPRTLPDTTPRVSNLPALDDAMLASLGWLPYVPDPAPSAHPIREQIVVTRTVTSAAVRETYTVVPVNIAQQAVNTASALAQIRMQRDARLRASDWTQMGDAPLAGPEKAAWVKYRAALRNLPATTTDPAFPVWPVPPDVTPDES